MLQNYRKAQDTTTIKWKKLILEACLGVFVPFCSFFEHFWGPKSKNIRFFAGIDLEWHETHFEMKISRKRSFLVQILSSCNLQKVSFMAADLFTCSFYAERSLQFHPLSRKPPLGSRRPEVNRHLFCHDCFFSMTVHAKMRSGLANELNCTTFHVPPSYRLKLMSKL